jgi:hypothetical protein
MMTSPRQISPGGRVEAEGAEGPNLFHCASLDRHHLIAGPAGACWPLMRFAGELAHAYEAT